MSRMQTLAQALQRMLSAVHIPVTQEWIGLDNAAERILACDIYSPMDVPAFDN